MSGATPQATVRQAVSSDESLYCDAGDEARVSDDKGVERNSRPWEVKQSSLVLERVCRRER